MATKRTAAAGRAALTSDALVAMMTASGHLLRDLDGACQEAGITHDQYNVLRILRGVYPEGHPRGEVSARLISRAPDVTRLLDRLAKGGFIKRDWHPSNRRLSIATITDAGLKLLAAADQNITAVQARYAAGLSDDELTALRRVCQRLVP